MRGIEMFEFSEKNSKLSDVFSVLDPNSLAMFERILGDETLFALSKTLKKTSRFRLRFAQSEKDAARVIQQCWNMFRIKSSFINDAYNTYLSLYSADEQESSDFNLSAVTYGLTNSLDYNLRRSPFVPPIKNNIFYHRFLFPWNANDNNLKTSIIIRELIKLFDIDYLAEDHLIIPCLNMATLPVEKMLSEYLPAEILKLLEYKIHAHHDEIVLVIIPKNLGSHHAEVVQRVLSKLGLSPTYQTLAVFVKKIIPEYRFKIEGLRVSPHTHFSRTLYQKKVTSIHDEIACIAQAVNQLVQALPGTVSDQAMYRIRLLQDIGQMFYAENYYRYVSHVVYPIIYEIGLHLMKHKEDSFLRRLFSDFSSVTEKVFLQSLGLEKEVLDNTFIASAMTASGCSAYSTAFLLAKKMRIDEAPKALNAYITYPFYFELSELSSRNSMFISSDSAADIYMGSLGPIVDIYRANNGEEKSVVQLGNDINLLIKQYYRGKPCVFILDTTTALYKNLSLDSECKALVNEGKVSIILFESNLKFRLMHTDQFQSGRVFVLCSKKYFSADDINRFMQNAEHDFKKHADLFISGYIAAHCESVLERIKQRHFDNGALLKASLEMAGRVTQRIARSPLSLANPEEQYFIIFDKSMRTLCRESSELFEYRDSFGHFRSSICDINRFSAGASDVMESMIEFAHLYWLPILYKQPDKFYDSLLLCLYQYTLNMSTDLPLNVQLCLLVLTHALNSGMQHQKSSYKHHIFTAVLPKILDASRAFSHREYYQVLRRQCQYFNYTLSKNKLSEKITSLLNMLSTEQQDFMLIQLNSSSNTHIKNPLWDLFLEAYNAYLKGLKTNHQGSAMHAYRKLLEDVTLLTVMIEEHKLDKSGELTGVLKQTLFKEIDDSTWKSCVNLYRTGRLKEGNVCAYIKTVQILSHAGLMADEKSRSRFMNELLNTRKLFNMRVFIETYLPCTASYCHKPNKIPQQLISNLTNQKIVTWLLNVEDDGCFASLFSGLYLLCENDLVSEQALEWLELCGGKYANFIASALLQLHQHQILCETYHQYLFDESFPLKEIVLRAHALIKLKKHNQLTTENINFLHQCSLWYGYKTDSFVEMICLAAQYNKLSVLYCHPEIFRLCHYTLLSLEVLRKVWSILSEANLLSDENIIVLANESSECDLFSSHCLAVSLNYFLQAGLLCGELGQQNFYVLLEQMMYITPYCNPTLKALGCLYQHNQLTQYSFGMVLGCKDEHQSAFAEAVVCLLEPDDIYKEAKLRIILLITDAINESFELQSYKQMFSKVNRSNLLSQMEELQARLLSEEDIADQLIMQYSSSISVSSQCIREEQRLGFFSGERSSDIESIPSIQAFHMR